MKISSSDILNELKEVSPLLAGMEKVNVFTIPEEYFETISATVLFSIKGKESTFDVPGGYFESLAGNILTKIKTGEINVADELKNLSAVLYSIQNENVFKVPAGYFAGLADTIVDKIASQQAIVIPIRKRNGIFKYAIAASVVGIMALGIYTVDKAFNFTGTNNSLAASLDPSIQKGTSMGDDQFNKILNSLSTQEIASYLEKHNDEADVAVLTSSLDENSVPNQDDYLVDEKTLDNYLQQLSPSQSKN
jgi:hypothetical protein